MRSYILIIALLVAWQPIAAAELQQRQLQQADDYFQATLFDQAIPLYEELLDQAPVAEQDHVRLRLAQSYYAQKKYDAILSLAQGHAAPRELFYLTGLAHKQKGDHASAQRAFERYLQTAPADNLLLFEEAHYELGQAAAQKNQWSAAAEHFGKIIKPGPLHDQAQLYLAKMAMAQNSYARAQQILAALDERLPKDEALHYEVAYIQGQTFYQLEDYSKAAHYFELALPKRKAESAAWVPDTLNLLGWSYLKLEQFDKAEAAFLLLHQSEASGATTLALGQLYLLKWQKLHDPKAQQAVEDILTRSPFFHSLENEAHSLVLRAAAASSYAQRKTLYLQLTQPKYQETSFFGQGWYLRGLNDYEGAQALKEAQKLEEARRTFASAGESFRKAYDLLQKQNLFLAGLSLKYQAEACGQQNNKEALLNALAALDRLTRQQTALLASFKDPGEIYYLQALYASYVAQWDAQDPYADQAEHLLNQGLRDYPKSSKADQMQFLLGTIYYQKKQYSAAENAFLQLTAKYTASSLLGDAWFWAARSSDSQQPGNDTAKAYRRKVFEAYPKSSYAAEAYFTYYPYRDYLQGDRAAIKHLQSMKQRYSRSPFLITAYYLIGMDNKRDRKSPEGKWLRKKNMNDAIEALQEAESIFDALYAEGKIPADDLKYLIKIRYRATLERALANLSIADESQGAKRQIFLEYAQEVFGTIVQDFKEAQHPLAGQLAAQQAYPHLLEESSYWLAQAYSRSREDEKAEQILSAMLEKYRSAKITRSYYLSRVWYDLGVIAMHREEYKLALQYFAHAEDAAKGKVLSTDQRIDLWIQESLCHKALNDTEKAMLILSKAINDDAISSLRVKAMYLRADLYAQQGRHELARKQLEATSKKGGEWALKAKQKMDQEYGY